MEAQDLIQDSHERRKNWNLFYLKSSTLALCHHMLNIFQGVFCEATMGVQKFSTHSIDSSNPKWNTSMQFQIYDLNKDVLSIGVYDRKFYCPNTFLGKTEFKILQIYREKMKENPDNNTFIRVFRMSQVPSGKLMLKMSISIYKQQK